MLVCHRHQFENARNARERGTDKDVGRIRAINADLGHRPVCQVPGNAAFDAAVVRRVVVLGHVRKQGDDAVVDPLA
ncbi:hypothetical protein D3C86_2106080 [compost metagenome]